MIPPNVLRWRAFAEQSAAAHPILSANEILAIVWSESTGNPLAINPSDPSYGLMQLTMPIAEAFGGVTDKGQLFNAQLNISIGSAFLAHLKETYAEQFPETWQNGYNQGEGNLTRGVPDPAYAAAFHSHLEELNDES